MGVYECRIDKTIEYKKVESTLKLPITNQSRDKLVEFFALYKKVKYYNNKVVRLENIEIGDSTIQLTISLIEFFDFLIINIIPAQLEDFIIYLKENDFYYMLCEDIECLRKYRSDMPLVMDFASLIADGHSSNALAISVLLTDEYGNYLLTQRGIKTGISEMMHSVTATGAIEEEDYHSIDVIKNCVIRELKEELNLCIDEKNLQICAIVAGKNKLQPIVIVNGKVQGSFRLLLENAKQAKDFDYEIDKLIIGNRKLLETIFYKEKFTEAVEYHLQSVIF